MDGLHNDPQHNKDFLDLLDEARESGFNDDIKTESGTILVVAIGQKTGRHPIILFGVPR